MSGLHETRIRSLTKTVIWRMVATSLTLGIVYFYTRQTRESLRITLTAATISVVAYYIHERIWDSIHWGKK